MFSVQKKLFFTLLSDIFFELPITRTPDNSNFFRFPWRFELSGVDCIRNRLVVADFHARLPLHIMGCNQRGHWAETNLDYDYKCLCSDERCYRRIFLRHDLPRNTPTSSDNVMLHLTRRFATTIFSATQRCNIIATLFRMVTTLFPHCNAVLRQKSSLRIVPCNITYVRNATALAQARPESNFAKLNERDMGGYGIEVLSFFSSGVSVILILKRGLAVSSSTVVSGFSSFWLTAPS